MVLGGPLGGRCRVGGGLQANPRGRGPLGEGDPQSPESEPLKTLPGLRMALTPPSTGFWATIEMSVTHQRTLVCGPTVYHFPQASPPFFSSRVRPLSLGRPSPGLFISGCRMLCSPLLRAGLPSTSLTLGWMGLKTKAEAGETGVMGCQCLEK